MIDPEAQRAQLLETVRPLRFIFWGGLLCLFDFSFSSTTNGEGFRFDILNDFVGMVLITFGVFRLGRLEVTHSFSRAMTFVKVVSVIATIKALIDHAIFQTPDGWGFFWTAFGLAELTAVIVFCLTMRLLCRVNELEEPARSWRTTSILFIIIFAAPLGLFYAASLIAIVTGESFHINLGPAGIPALLVLAIPLIHLFVSTSRMARAAESIGTALPPFDSGD